MRIKKLLEEWKIAGILLVLIVCGAFLLRIYNLTTIPIFVDEAIYIHWAQIISAESTQRFLPQSSEGKQPLFMWMMTVFLVLINDPLVAGRLLSVITGIFTLLGVFLTMFYLSKSKKVALIACLIYAISPFTLFFDRMALADSMLTMFGVWTMLFSALLARTGRLDTAMLTGFSLGGALLTKSPAIFFALLLPASWLLSIWPKSATERVMKLLKLTVLNLIALAIAFLMYNILRLGPGFEQIGIQNQKYVFPISHLWTNPLDPFVPHIKDVAIWFWDLGPSAFIFLVLIGLTAGLLRRRVETLFVSIWVFVPLTAVMMYGRVFTARYILYTIPPLIMLAAFVFAYLKEKYAKLLFIVLGIFILQAIWT
ncbi:MAG: ArnT family glycosyltransferase, partial [Alphaproteobacteria bacterium]